MICQSFHSMRSLRRNRMARKGKQCPGKLTHTNPRSRAMFFSTSDALTYLCSHLLHVVSASAFNQTHSHERQQRHLCFNPHLPGIHGRSSKYIDFLKYTHRHPLLLSVYCMAMSPLSPLWLLSPLPLVAEEPRNQVYVCFSHDKVTRVTTSVLGFPC